MSLKLSVTQAQQVDKGAQIPGLIGKVKKVFPQKQGSRPNSDETYLEQGLVLCDLSDAKAEVILSVYDQPPYDSSIEGKTVEVSPGQKGGLRGAGTYTNKKNEIVYKIQASKMCTLEFGGTAAPARPAQAPTQSSAPRPAAQTAPAPAPRASMSWADYLACEEEIMGRCIETAIKICSKTDGRVAWDAPQIASIAATLRIEAAKNGLGVNSPLGGAAKPTAARPAPAPTDEAGGGSEDDSDDVPF